MKEFTTEYGAEDNVTKFCFQNVEVIFPPQLLTDGDILVFESLFSLLWYSQKSVATVKNNMPNDCLMPKSKVSRPFTIPGCDKR